MTVSGDRRQRSGEFQFELVGVVKDESTLSVVGASVRVYVRRKSLAAAAAASTRADASPRRRRRRFARVAIYRTTPDHQPLDEQPLAQMTSRVRRGRPLELLLPTSAVDEALNEARPEARVLRLRIVCHQCRLDNRRRRRQGRRVGARRPGMASQLIRRRRRGQLQSNGQLPSLVISFKVKDRSQQPATAAAAPSSSSSL